MAKRHQDLETGGDEKLKIKFMWPNMVQLEDQLCTTVHAECTCIFKVSRSLEQFDVKEKSSAYLAKQCPNVTVWTNLVESVEPLSHSLSLADGTRLKYDKLCICTGGRPKVCIKLPFP